jgi:hypothetical protein
MVYKCNFFNIQREHKFHIIHVEVWINDDYFSSLGTLLSHCQGEALEYIVSIENNAVLRDIVTQI